MYVIKRRISYFVQIDSNGVTGIFSNDLTRAKVFPSRDSAQKRLKELKNDGFSDLEVKKVS